MVRFAMVFPRALRLKTDYYLVTQVYGGAGDKRLYVNGKALTLLSNVSVNVSFGTKAMGAYTGPLGLFAATVGGQVDEFRVMPTAASADWISADYQQQASAEGVLYVAENPPVAMLPAAATGLVYTGAEQTGVAVGTGYTVENGSATDVGNYTATLTLDDGCEKWSDGSTDKTRTISWSIDKGVNAWTMQPSISPTTWNEGMGQAITISNGANTFGSEVTCDTTEAELRDLNAGATKTVTFTVAGCGNYDAITHQVTVRVLAPGELIEGWGYSNRVTIAETDYMVFVFTNTSQTIEWKLPRGVRTIDYLVVGGGGSGGRSGNVHGAGGGGAGGVITNVGPCEVTGGAKLEISVGAGGEAQDGAGAGCSGKDSVLKIGGVSYTAFGGGGGGQNGAGQAGGCGGGAGCRQTGTDFFAGGEGKQGFNGGSAVGGVTYRGGGGGGAGSAGCDYTVSTGKGGAGIQSDITGEMAWYSAGGGAAGTSNTGVYGRGGEGGGGTGSHYVSNASAFDKTKEATSGSTYGSGGGGASHKCAARSGAGCQGVVVIRYAIPVESPETPQPTVDGKSVAFDQDTFAALVSTSDIVFPAEPALEKSADGTVVTFAGKNVTIKDCYKVEVVSTEGGFRMTLALDPEVVTPVIEGEEEKEAFVLTDEAVSIHITNARSDLWYALETADALGPAAEWTVDSSTWTQGGDLTAAKTDNAARFYRVIVRDVKK